MRWLAMLATLTACSSEPTAPAEPDAAPPDAAAPLEPTHLVLSEVYSQVAIWEFIEIINRRSFGWSMDLVLDPAYLLLSISLGLGAGLVAGLYPAWSISRLAPVAWLRYE